MLQSKTWEPSFCLSSRPHGQLRETLQGDAGVNWETALLSTERATSIQDGLSPTKTDDHVRRLSNQVEHESFGILLPMAQVREPEHMTKTSRVT